MSHLRLTVLQHRGFIEFFGTSIRHAGVIGNYFMQRLRR